MVGRVDPWGDCMEAPWRPREGKRQVDVGRRGHRAALGRPYPRLSRDSAPSPDANRNVMSQPSALLVVFLNVSLNTLPVLAFRIIYQALKKPCPKVMEAGVPTAHLWNPDLFREPLLQGDMGMGAELETQMDTPCPQGAVLPGVEKARPVLALRSLGSHQELPRTWGSS